MAGIIKSSIFFGKIITSDLPNVVRVSLNHYVMDPRFTMYFKKKVEVYADDKNKECKEGDFVIIKEIPESQMFYAEGNKVKYHVDKLLYKRGAMVDPLTGKRVAGTEYIDDIKRVTELFGYQRPYFTTSKNSENVE